MKIALLIPPLGSITHPPLSLPSLAAYLRDIGHEVHQCDLGMLALDAMLTPGRLETRRRKISEKLSEMRNIDSVHESQNMRLEQLAAAEFIAEDVIENIERAKHILRSDELFYKPDNYIYASNIVRRGLDIISLAHYPTEMYFDDVDYKIKMTFENLYALSRDEERNPFLSVMRDEALPRALPDILPVVGISVSFIPQLVSGYTLARLIKSVSPETHVVMGGGAVISAEERIRSRPEAFQWVDSYVFGEGESALKKLIEIIESDFTVANDMNKLYLKFESAAGRESKTTMENLAEREDFSALPTPDYSGLNLDDYLSPEPLYSLATTRGCYHGKCAFCGLSLVFKNRFYQRPPDLLKEDIMRIQHNRGGRHFFFTDDCIPPPICRKITDFAADLPGPFYWMAEIRFEKQFDRELLEKMYRSGCRLLSFGNESGNQRVLELMRKKTEIERNRQITTDAARAGIGVHLQNFIGFPGETLEEANDTVEFLISVKDYACSFALATFQLAEYSPVHLEPESFGVGNIKPRDPDELIPQFHFTTESGPSADELNRFYEDASERLRQAYPADNDFLDGPVGAHALLFYSRYGETKKEKILPPPPAVSGMSEKKPLLRPSVKSIPLSNEASYIYNSETAKITRLSGAGYEWLKLADGQLSLKETGLQLHRILSENHPELTVRDALASAFFTADFLYRSGFIELE